MKTKTNIFIVCILFFCGLLCIVPQNLHFFVEGKAQVFYKQKVIGDYDSLEIGEGCVVYCDSFQIKKLPQNYYAVTIKVFEQTSIEKILKRLCGTILFEEELEQLKVFYGHSPILKESVYIKNKKINFQIAISGDDIVIGCPLIAGEY